MQSLDISRHHHFMDNTIISADLLRQIFERENNWASAYQYARIKIATSDSILIANNGNQLLEIDFDAKTRVLEAAKKLKEEKREHELNVLYLGISVTLIAFLFFFLVIVRTIVVNEKFVTYFGTIGLLIVFEFVNMAIHPYLEAHGPFVEEHNAKLFMLAVLVAIASILERLHHKLDKYVRHQLVEKE